MRRLLIAGSRNIAPDVAEFDLALALLRNGSHEYEQFTVVTGGARGVDQAGYHWAEVRHHINELHPADWEAYGKRAGYVRNAEMVQSGIDLAIVFWDGESKGTANTMQLLRAKGVNHVVRVSYE